MRRGTPAADAEVPVAARIQAPGRAAWRARCKARPGGGPRRRSCRRAAGSAARRGRSGDLRDRRGRSPLGSLGRRRPPGARRASSTPRASPRPTPCPLAFARGERAERRCSRDRRPAGARPARVGCAGGHGVALRRALATRASPRRCSTRSQRRRRFRGRAGRAGRPPPAPAFRELRGGEAAGAVAPARASRATPRSCTATASCSSSSAALEPGINPDLEIGRFLTEQTTFRTPPPVAGWLEIRGAGREPLHARRPARRSCPTRGTPGRYTLDVLGRYFERVLTGRERGDHAPAADAARSRSWSWPAGEVARRGCGADRHLPATRPSCSASAPPRCTSPWPRGRDEPDFAPEPFSLLYQRSLYQSMRTLAGRTFQLLAAAAATTCPEARGRRPSRCSRPQEPRDRALRRACSTSKISADAHPLPRRLPPRAGALHRQGLRDHRLRGRAGAAAVRAPAQALALPRRGRHAALVPLRGLCQAVRGDARPAWCRPGALPALESWALRLGALGLGRLPARLPGPGRGRARSCRRRARSSRCCSTSTCSRRRSTSWPTS